MEKKEMVKAIKFLKVDDGVLADVSKIWIEKMSRIVQIAKLDKNQGASLE